MSPPGLCVPTPKKVKNGGAIAFGKRGLDGRGFFLRTRGRPLRGQSKESPFLVSRRMSPVGLCLPTPKKVKNGGAIAFGKRDSTVVAFFYGRGVDRFAVNLKSRLIGITPYVPRRAMRTHP
jgi:hypothetical protein